MVDFQGERGKSRFGKWRIRSRSLRWRQAFESSSGNPRGTRESGTRRVGFAVGISLRSPIPESPGFSEQLSPGASCARHFHLRPSRGVIGRDPRVHARGRSAAKDQRCSREAPSVNRARDNGASSVVRRPSRSAPPIASVLSFTRHAHPVVRSLVPRWPRTRHTIPVE